VLLAAITQNIGSKKILIVLAICLLTINSWIEAADATDKKQQPSEQIKKGHNREAAPEKTDFETRRNSIKSDDYNQDAVRELENELDKAVNAAADKKVINPGMDSR